VLLLKISTAIIGIVLIAGCLWLLKKPHLKWFLKLLQPSVIIGVTLTLTIGVLFFDIQTHISGLFSFAFSKDITFSGRTWFWEDGISKLAQYDQIHRLWGYGFHNISVWTSWTWIDFTSEAHNQLLQMLHDVGIIGTVMLYIIWFLQMHAIKKCNNKDIRNIIACTCFTFLIMCITEIYCYYPAFFVVFSIAARSEDIVENLNLHQFNWRNKT
jgi:O-antigen ligase